DRVWDAEIHQIDFGVLQDPPDVVGHALDTELRGERARPVWPVCRHPAELDVDPAHVPIGLRMETSHETGPDHAHPHPPALSPHPPPSLARVQILTSKHLGAGGGNCLEVKVSPRYSAEPKFHSIVRTRPSRRRKCTVSG